MQAHLEHFRALSTKIDADRVAYNAAMADLLERINAAAATAGRIEEAGGDATKQRTEVRRLKQERAKLTTPSFVNPLADVETFARTHKAAAAVESVVVDVPTGQTPLAVHNNAADKTNSVIAELGRVIAAPSVPEDLAEAIASQIDAIATSPRVVGGKLVFPRHVIDSNGMAITVVNTEGLMAWLHGPAIIAKMAEDSAESDSPGLTTAERATQLAALQEKLVAALRLEAAAAMAAEQAGQRVVRRRHVHPAILLGLKVTPALVWDWLAKKRGA